MGMRAFSLDLEAHVLSLAGEGSQLLTNHATQGIVDQGLISDRAARFVGWPGNAQQCLQVPPASATLVVTSPVDSYQIRYAANLNIGDSFVDVTNNGASGGNICVNVYTFDQSEELLACCSCFVTPNGLAGIGRD